MLRHMVKPGITGRAQVNGWRGDTDPVKKMQKRVEHDMHYIRNWSLALDVKIVALMVKRAIEALLLMGRWVPRLARTVAVGS